MEIDKREHSEQTAGLPFSKWLPFIVGAIYGLIMRLLFAALDIGASQMEVMTSAFIIIVPIAVGVITIILAERKARRRVVYYIFAPWLSVLVFVAGTAIALVEGSICIVMALPLFLVLSSFGGLIAGLVARFTMRSKSVVNGFAILPILFGLYEVGLPLPVVYNQVNRSIHISSSADVIWHHINYPLDIRPEELEGGFAYMIGVPYPIEARTLDERVGGMRNLVWQRGVSFQEEITAWEENSYIAWEYIFSENSFPSGSMDDHVVVGGDYFDLENTSYTLTPELDGTRLEISVGYRISTSFNWYSKLWGEFLITDTADVILKFYKNRAESLTIG